jgi:hypothetical protein
LKKRLFSWFNIDFQQKSQKNPEWRAVMEEKLTILFCFVDDFCQEFLPQWEAHLLKHKLKRRRRETALSISEIMTIYIHFHQSHYRDFKNYYLCHVRLHLKKYFPNLVSYPRFVSLIQRILVPLYFFLNCLKGEKTGIYFVDSTLLKACHIKREKQHKVFRGIAEKAKSTMGWFFGFKLHLVVNDKGEIMAFKITKGNVDDRRPVPDLVKKLIGKLVGDKGYISKKLFQNLYQQGLELITKIKKNMKNQLINLENKFLLRKRAIIESINDQLKNISQIEHTRHRSVWNFMANVFAGLIAYAMQPKKPSISMARQPLLVRN